MEHATTDHDTAQGTDDVLEQITSHHSTAQGTDEVLERKLAAAQALIEGHNVSAERAEILRERMTSGHAEHHQTPREIDLPGEMVSELADILGYEAIGMLIEPPTPVDAGIVMITLRLWDLVDAKAAGVRDLMQLGDQRDEEGKPL